MSLPVCKYGPGCYRKNPAHLNSFSHPWFQSDPSPPPQAAPQSPTPPKPTTQPDPHGQAPTKSKLPDFLVTSKTPATTAPQPQASPKPAIPNPTSSKAPKRSLDADNDVSLPDPKKGKNATHPSSQEVVLMYSHESPPLFCIGKMALSRWESLRDEVLSGPDNVLICEDYGITTGTPSVQLTTTHEVISSTTVLSDAKQVSAFAELFGGKRFVGTSRRLLWHDILPSNFP